jgi:hypothetical protein
VNVKANLALLWVALMFFFIYNDLFSLMQPGHVADLVEGHLEGVQYEIRISDQEAKGRPAWER